MKEATAPVTLVAMAKGQEGTIHSVSGCDNLCRRLEALGIRPGCRFSKVSNAFLRGPVMIRIGSARVAIGHRMAGRVMVEVDGSA